MYKLYPRLPLAVAEELARRQASTNVEILTGSSTVHHPDAYYAPTGGNRASEADIEAIQDTIRGYASDFGFPELPLGDNTRRFDTRCGIYLFEQMHIYPSEASHLEVWAFLTTVVVPDVVRWRFSGEQTTIERFIGSDRGLRRNAFGRLWWRVYLLHEPDVKDPYHLFEVLVEDDLVQITERPSIAANPALSTALCEAYIQTLIQYKTVSRRILIREGIKRVRRLTSIISFTALDRTTIQQITTDLFMRTAYSLLLETQTPSEH